ncbi:MAG: PspC domain-containing protein [Actinomycetota bacterium]|nr:PspC domain-containing protein [Actinomycetota bacterium]
MTHTQNTQTAPPGRSLRRSNEEKILAGVAGGLGQHLGINAWWFRWAFILLAFAGGAGVLLYILAWIFVPSPDEDDTAVSQWLSTLDLSDGGTILGVVLIGAASVIVAASILDISGGLIAAGILFAIGFMLYRGGLTAPTKPAAPPTSGGTTDGPGQGSKTEEPDMAEPSTGEVDGSADHPAEVAAAAAVASTVVEASPAKIPRPKKPPRERSMLGQLTVAIGIIVLSLMALLDVSGISIGSVDSGEFFDPVHYAATALAIVAIGLVAGAWFGRARWLIVIGILLLPVVFVTSLWPRTFPWSAGDPVYQL